MPDTILDFVTLKANRLTGAKIFLLLLPLIFFCAARPANAQTKYYIGGCTGETAGLAAVNCSPSPGIGIGAAVAVYVRWDNNSGSLSSLVDAGGNCGAIHSSRQAALLSAESVLDVRGS
jgi:hypothetical protein